MVLDASVLAKLFVAEDLSNEARALVANTSDLWAPAHVLAEVGEVLCRKVALGEITTQQCDMALALAPRVVRTAPLDDLIGPAALIAQEIKVSVYDALYLALALARQDVLTTWDKRLLRTIKGTRFEGAVKPLLASWTP